MPVAAARVSIAADSHRLLDTEEALTGQGERRDPARRDVVSSHEATVAWFRIELPEGYSRAHTWEFDGGATVPASSSPGVVPVPLSDPGGVDPEEAFVASISACHMLWFLALAEARGIEVIEYRDPAVGQMGRNADNRLYVERVHLRPAVRYRERAPTTSEEEALHADAHRRCFIANSVRTEVTVEVQTD